MQDSCYIVYEVIMNKCDLIFEKDTLLKNNFDQMFTFNRLPFHYLVQEVNEIWYLHFLDTKFYRFPIQIGSHERLKVSV